MAPKLIDGENSNGSFHGALSLADNMSNTSDLPTVQHSDANTIALSAGKEIARRRALNRSISDSEDGKQPESDSELEPAAGDKMEEGAEERSHPASNAEDQEHRDDNMDENIKRSKKDENLSKRKTKDSSDRRKSAPKKPRTTAKKKKNQPISAASVIGKELETVSNLANYNKLFGAILTQMNTPAEVLLEKRASLLEKIKARQKQPLSTSTNTSKPLSFTTHESSGSPQVSEQQLLRDSSDFKTRTLGEQSRQTVSLPFRNFNPMPSATSKLNGSTGERPPMAKRQLRQQLRKAAIHQGAEEQARLLGCRNSAELRRKIELELEEEKRRDEFMKRKQIDLADALKKVRDAAAEEESEEGDDEEEDDEEKEFMEDEESKNLVSADIAEEEQHAGANNADGGNSEGTLNERDMEDDQENTTTRDPISSVEPSAPKDEESNSQTASSSKTSTTIRHKYGKAEKSRRRIVDTDEEKEDDDEKDSKDDVVRTSTNERSETTAGNTSASMTNDESADSRRTSGAKDRASHFRDILRQEREQLKGKMKKKKNLGALVDDEAEESDDDMPNKQTLFEFGFGMKLDIDGDKKEDDEEKALQEEESAGEEDLEGIVDELSDDEEAKLGGEAKAFHEIQTLQDKQEIKQVMQSLREGFGRKEKAISRSKRSGRGRFDLNRLTAVDGDKSEAARLGLLESDEELSDAEDGEKSHKKKGHSDNDESEEDEEELLERQLKERHWAAQEAAVLSSSDSEAEEADGAEGDADGQLGESDEEARREKEQAKAFALRCKMNRRLKRMNSLSSQGSQRLMDRDSDSQQIMKTLRITNKATTVRNRIAPGAAHSATRTTSTSSTLHNSTVATKAFTFSAGSAFRPSFVRSDSSSSTVAPSGMNGVAVTSSMQTLRPKAGSNAAARLNQSVSTKRVVFQKDDSNSRSSFAAMAGGVVIDETSNSVTVADSVISHANSNTSRGLAFPALSRSATISHNSSSRLLPPSLSGGTSRGKSGPLFSLLAKQQCKRLDRVPTM